MDAKTGKLIGEEVYDYDKMIGIADRKIQLSDVAPLVPEAFAA